MNTDQSNYKPTLPEAVFVTAVVLFIMGFGIIKLEITPHIPILFSIILLIFFGLFKKIPFKLLHLGLTNGASSGIGAMFLLLMIGLLIASWMMSGTIPTLIYTGFAIVTPKYFYAVAFVVTSVAGIAIGSSLTTIATIGLAFMAIADTMGLSLPVMAGAIVSGAFFGDKMSPLSDTTNLASAVLNVDLFDHIRNMGWTTIPAFIISLILFAVFSPSVGESDLSQISHLRSSLAESGLIHWYSWIPIILMVIFSIKKIPALLSLALSSITALILSLFHLKINAADFAWMLFSGYVSDTGNGAVDALLTRGGIESMFFTMSLVLFALGMGGLLFQLGILPRLIEWLDDVLSTVKSSITGAALTAIGINVIIGEQYLSILLTGKSFQEKFRQLGLANKNLSRVLEDAGTVVNPLVPWSVCGVFISSVLGISVLEYVPFAFFCLLSPVLTILFGFTGKTLTYIKN